jgi:hypothetical protein
MNYRSMMAANRELKAKECSRGQKKKKPVNNGHGTKEVGSFLEFLWHAG